jgi:hypothetical protein
MTQKFLDAVEAGNLISVRYSLSNELLLDPRGDSYREMKDFAEKRLGELYEPMDGELPEAPVGGYAEEDLMDLKNALDANFSRERLEHYEQVAAVVLRDKAEQMEMEVDGQEENEESKRECVAKQNKDWKTPVITGGVVGAATSVATKILGGASLGHALVAGLGAAVAAGAAVNYIKNNDGEDEEL